MNKLIILLIFLERVVFATIGLIAIINGKFGWGIFMGCMILILIINTEIKVGGKNEQKN